MRGSPTPVFVFMIALLAVITFCVFIMLKAFNHALDLQVNATPTPRQDHRPDIRHCIYFADKLPDYLWDCISQPGEEPYATDKEVFAQMNREDI